MMQAALLLCLSECSCDVSGAVSSVCNVTTGQCLCRENVMGRTCDRCQVSNTWHNDARAPMRAHTHTLVQTSEPIFRSVLLCRLCFQFVLLVLFFVSFSWFQLMIWFDFFQSGFFGLHSGRGCQACGCKQSGALSESCDQSGRCQCEEGFAGDKCDRCAHGYYGSHANKCTGS